jgi:4-hydroxybenzoate polyprenyltransferase
MIAFLRLIRIQNLLIIAFTQYMVRWCLIYPIFKLVGLPLMLSELSFFLLSLSTVMIAAAGYIINDYFDVKIDKVNKPHRLVVGKGVKRRVAIGAHTVINVLAVLIGLIASWMIGSWSLVVFHFVCAGGLWFYSTTFKRQFLIGNLLIALFTAFVPFVAGFYELLAAVRNVPEAAMVIGGAWRWLLAVSLFAFISTLLREIIKDIEDYEGDKEFGCRTMPIVIGIRPAKNVVIFLSLLSIGLLLTAQIMLIGQVPPGFIYFMIPIQLGFLFLMWKVKKASVKADYRGAGNTAKVLMLMGVCYLFLLFYYLVILIS